MGTEAAPQQQPTSPPVYIPQGRQGPGCLVQAIWFVFVGWWLGGFAITLAWILNVTIIGLPLGMAILNSLPKLLALQEPQRNLVAVTRAGVTVVNQADRPQYNFVIRTLYFLVIGWWWSGVWLAIAFALAATVILLPIALEMFRLTPAMTTLRRY
jgi:uncharacterized membrane protein YccF (DUF307 family)